MRPRLEPLAIPSSGRYFVVDLTRVRAARLEQLDEQLDEQLAGKLADADRERLTKTRAAVAARPDRGEHHFRLPAPSRLERLVELQDARSGSGGLAELRSALVGACWRHRTRELEASWPEAPTVRGLVDFAELVQLELLDAGYTEAEIAILGDRCVRAVRERVIDGAEVQRVADFS